MEEEQQTSWGAYVVVGVLGAVWINGYLANMEASGAGFRGPLVFVSLYQIAGRGGIVAAFALAALGAFLLGVKNIYDGLRLRFKPPAP